MRQTAIRIKAEFAIPADTTDIDQFQAAVAKANQLKAYAEEIGIVTSFESKIGNVDVGEPVDADKEPEVDDNSSRATFPAQAMKADEADQPDATEAE